MAFFFSPKKNKFDEIIENTISFINDHKSFVDFDDFEEGSETRIGKSTIIYFNDKNKDKFANYFITKHNRYYIPLIIFVGKNEENYELKKKNNKAIKDLQKNIDPNIFKYSSYDENLENNLINLNFNLMECALFYNDIGDEKISRSLYKDEKLMDLVLKNAQQNFATFNILVCGRPGVGKSTFINGILKTMICNSQRGKECPQKIVKYIHRDLPITFYNTPGISEESKIQTIIELKEKKNKELGESQSKIHAVFYVLSGQEARSFMTYENRMFKLILEKYRIKIYFVITKVQSEEERDEKLPHIIRNYYKVTKDLNIGEEYKREKISEYIYFINVIGKSNINEIDKLFEHIYEDFKGYKINEEITINNISKITRRKTLLPYLSKPQDIISYPLRLCQYMNLKYRLIASYIDMDNKSSTLISVEFLRIISYIFGIRNISIEECKKMIKEIGFDIDENNKDKKSEFKHWFK